LDSTWQGGTQSQANSTTDSALGALLSIGNFYAAGTTSASGTSRYFSVDHGLVHLVALDLNGYYDTDPCGQSCLDAQMEWLGKDLAQANKNRDTVPWVVVMSHYPFYCTGCQDVSTSAAWYNSDAAETRGNLNMSADATARFQRARACAAATDAAGLCDDPELDGWAKSVKQGSDASIKDLVLPYMQAYGVDVYMAGHWHYYESLWPAEYATNGSGGAPLEPKSFVHPTTTVHVTQGNGGPPGPDTFCEDPAVPSCKIASARMQTNEYSYSRVTAWNASHLQIQTFLNKNGTMFDDFTVVASKHGPFPTGR